MNKCINGTQLAKEIKQTCKQITKQLPTTPTLVIMQVGHDPASDVYIKGKKKDCDEIGIRYIHAQYPKSITQDELCRNIRQYNNDQNIHGIIVQLPLPSHIDEHLITTCITPEKDVDGFHPINLGNLIINNTTLISCTPLGIVSLIQSVCPDLTGKQCVVIGRSNHVGKPTAILLTQKNATVTLTHSKTKNLEKLTSQADILVVAIGKPKFITDKYIKPNAIVIDVGIHRQENNHLCGDVDFDNVYEKVQAITPVPGGVGPMTRAMLMYNCIKATAKQTAPDIYNSLCNKQNPI